MIKLPVLFNLKWLRHAEDDKLEQEALDRLKAYGNQFELDKSKAIAQHVQWMTDRK